MATLLPPHGSVPVSIVFTLDEALTALASLTAMATYANQPIREVLGEYIDRLKAAAEQ